MNDDEAARRSFTEGLAFLDANDLKNAEIRMRETLRLKPRSVPALTNLAVALLGQGKKVEALGFATLAADIGNFDVHATLALADCLAAEGKFADVVAACDRILAVDPTIADVHQMRGSALSKLGRKKEALASFDQAARCEPTHLAAHLGRAGALAELNRLAEALAAFDHVLMLKPDVVDALIGRGNVCCELKRFDEALAAHNRALALRPASVLAWLGLGNVHAELKRHTEALAAYDAALRLKPDLSQAWIGRGNACRELAQSAAALAAYDRALQIQPDQANAWAGRGTVLLESQKYEDALAAFERAFQLNPKQTHVEGTRLHIKMQLCDWRNFEADRTHLLASLHVGVEALQPFELLSVTQSAADQLACARLAAAQTAIAAPLPAKSKDARIRIAYFSPDLREHAVSYLLAGVIEQHDRRQFECWAVSFGPEQASPMRARMKSAFDHFLDVGALGDPEVVRLARQHEIDIAIDLTGYTRGARPGIFAARAAPVQVNYLGYPGTSGAPYIDYIIGDRFLVPEQVQQYYSEKVVYLPDCFQANDAKRPRPPAQRSRAKLGLPPDGFVFCSFNSASKITPDMFDVWMRLLRAVDGSVLWLLAPNAEAERNLRREAAARGVAAERIVLAPRAGYQDYLAQYRLAGLFLDSFPFNAGTTASDALWMGLPLVTCAGEAFASRMAGSLLQALGLTELITTSLHDYEVLALALARDAARLGRVRQKLADGRDTGALFDTKKFTQHLEAAYLTMCDRQRRGLPPASFAVS